MANVLLLDANEVAGRAMQGILARGHHRCIVAPTIAEAWKALHDMVNIDLIFLELELKGEKGTDFLLRLRADCFLKQIPVIVYTATGDHATVRKVLLLKVQNYLIKPYNDEYIFREVAKAGSTSWRALQFEEEKSFCVQMGYKTETLRDMRQDLSASLDKSIPFFTGCVTSRNPPQVHARIDALSDKAEACGVWGVVDCMKELKEKAEQADWTHFKHCEEDLAYARELILFHLDPKRASASSLSDEEKQAQRESEVRAIWMQADVDKSGPMIDGQDVLLQAEALPACPTIDSIAASFLMTADKTAANLNQINDLVAKDPSLVTQVLIAANHLDHDEMTVIDDPRTAVGLLGNLRLTAMAKSLPVIPERHLHLPPITWVHFWMFQMGVARLAQFTARYLEFEMLVGRAHTAGLLQDVGKLVLLKLFPFGFPAMVNYAREHQVPLHEAERKYIGCTTREIGERFGRKLGLPNAYCNVIRWTETPEQAGEDVELVGVVALARDLCLHSHVGFCGDTPKDTAPPLEETAAWRVLRSRVFPSFNLKKFESEAHAYCVELKQTLSGKQSS
ncbi:MAG: HDOD domain-containing protein [Opitutaceae bacterium]|nr:HDOD domain-containing protein [Opitutaceae bacterium]